MYHSYAQNVEIKGISDIGGIVGETEQNSTIRCTYNNVKIIANGMNIRLHQIVIISIIIVCMAQFYKVKIMLVVL